MRHVQDAADPSQGSRFVGAAFREASPGRRAAEGWSVKDVVAAGYSQLRPRPWGCLWEGHGPPVAAAYRLHTGALLGAARAQLAAALIVACGELASERGRRGPCLPR